MDPLTFDGITTEEKMYLGGLMQHPGWSVFRKLIENGCEQLNRRVVKLNSEDANYERSVIAFQREAHIINEYAAALIKSVMMHSKAGEIEGQAKKLQEEVEREVAVVDGKVGSMAVKPRKSE